MALQQFVFGLIVVIICTSKGGHASLVCGNVQGPDESPKNWPWQVSITNDSGYVCGGTLINDQWVLTPHQFFLGATGINISTLVVHLGSTVSSSFSGSNVTRGVNATFCPLSSNYYYDASICLLKLSAPVSFSPNVQPVCIASKGSTFHTRDSAWVAGWTTQNYGLYKQHTYYEVSMSVVGPNECSCHRGSTISTDTLCAESTNYTSLQTAGFPLVVKQDSTRVWVLAGVSGVEHCSSSNPCVYAKVSQYQDWIMGVIGSKNQTGFVNVTSSGMDSDMDFNCTYNRLDIFSGGDKVIPHFSQLLSLCALTLLLFVMG